MLHNTCKRALFSHFVSSSSSASSSRVAHVAFFSTPSATPQQATPSAVETSPALNHVNDIPGRRSRRKKKKSSNAPTPFLSGLHAHVRQQAQEKQTKDFAEEGRAIRRESTTSTEEQLKETDTLRSERFSFDGGQNGTLEVPSLTEWRALEGEKKKASNQEPPTRSSSVTQHLQEIYSESSASSAPSKNGSKATAPTLKTPIAKKPSPLSQLMEENWKETEWKDDLTVKAKAQGQTLLKPSVTGRLKKKKKRSKSNETRLRDPPPHGALIRNEVSGVLKPEGEVLRVAKLAHGLDRVLFNPGVHWVQDPRSRVYNFTPWLEKIPKVSEFDYDRIPGFVPSSRDNDLRSLALREKKRFCGSTSSLSGILSQCYFLISETKEVDTSCLSQAFRNQPKTFSPGQRWPASIILNYKDGVYCIDSDKSKTDFPEKTVLTWLGTLLEKFLTLNPAKFKQLLKASPEPPESESMKNEREPYRYAKSKAFVMRSQLDCYDPRLPGTGVFDIKTRACVATRLDILNYEEHTGYTIKKQTGRFESFEKEYYDLIRSAFLKYSFQVRIGNMDGVIVAYHNTGRMFGFQYIPLSEMDACLYGSTEPGVGDRVFEKCVGLMEKVMDEVAGCFKKQSLKATFETKEDTKGMYIWVEPLEWNGPEEQRPIEQLRVEVTSYLGEDPVKGIKAAVTTDGDWTMKYKISRLTLTNETKRENLASARARQNPAFLIPSHVAEDELEAYWASLNHSGKPSEQEAEFNPNLFMQPPPAIQHLRYLSRVGKAESERETELYGDQPKVVWRAKRPASV
ncbi:hypothetical protein CC1G_03456 [Coprinopsis cinerea okayama7|uniref:Pet127-domain-containing protein n=1 Tax=Coprinopsis cinerea (strain Okayama-7 / 130 / ATCC MYA-4618 / FGSC 9003) TaxID=240176 RepID=A8NQT1_COPC7|nr:hypothetical protein CC1G_03456 [Coprinopsis cinerea okayama7\|eukprot:XP_001835674.2 hypothetical protein CC1G_03456 [Coprinopsis cinerea okayama7\